MLLITVCYNHIVLFSAGWGMTDHWQVRQCHGLVLSCCSKPSAAPSQLAGLTWLSPPPSELSLVPSCLNRISYFTNVNWTGLSYTVSYFYRSGFVKLQFFLCLILLKCLVLSQFQCLNCFAQVLLYHRNWLNPWPSDGNENSKMALRRAPRPNSPLI